MVRSQVNELYNANYKCAGIIKLAHFSLKEYLIERLRYMAEALRCTCEQLSHSVIAQICLAQLLYFDRESILDGESPGT